MGEELALSAVLSRKAAESSDFQKQPVLPECPAPVPPCLARGSH